MISRAGASFGPLKFAPKTLRFPLITDERTNNFYSKALIETERCCAEEISGFSAPPGSAMQTKDFND